MSPVTELDPLLAFWRTQDALFERVDETWWGAVVSDARFPAIQEPNYARVETRSPVRMSDVESELLPALARSGSTRSHVVIFFPEDQTDLIAEASTRGERIAWDLVMVREGAPPPVDDRVREVRDFGEAFWRSHATSTRLFDIDEQPTIDQLQALEREVLIPAGRRWFVVQENGGPVAFAALLVLEGSGFLDHVVTFPGARRRGHAEALTRRALAEAAEAGAERTYLLAEPEGGAERIYGRLGFGQAGHLASWLSRRPA
jgi:ribosomal protein S18 acetylase RimI-like enzyme